VEILRPKSEQFERVWVGSIGVRPAWRRLGLGLALLRDSFRRFREAGETIVVLWRADVWQKELRAGA
jgi:ribosomal protein S18 acetylase RimI-like enzyme